MNLRKTIILGVSLLLLSPVYSQEMIQLAPVTQVGLKANLLGYATTTLSVGAEIKLAPRYTLDLSLTYNPWSFTEEKMKHILFQPELRYWFCEAFHGAFAGLHAHAGYYNVGGMGLSDYIKEHRFEGWLAGAGISYGYQWILSERISLEATIGVGFAYMDYEIFPCEKCGAKIKDKASTYFGPTRAGISLIYILK
ncbi:MAG: DUF3575 domain-containing protein [Tannerellaceae bacterium]|nr:DUF3575 domain-containing protein [Tannerellaceae bacterium]